MPIKRELYDFNRFHKSLPHRSNYPVISNVQVAIGNFFATITWDTDVLSTSQVAYGLTPDKNWKTPYDSTYVTSHSVTISTLQPGFVYYFNVQSFRLDALSISATFTFIAVSPALFLFLQEDGSARFTLESGSGSLGLEV